jgi:predicted SpoU family rRNA methylase
MRLLIKLNHELNKRILHADAIGGAFRFECPVNIKRDVLKNYGRHWLSLHVSIFGRYVINAKRFIKIMFRRWVVNLCISHNNTVWSDLHSPAFGNRSAIDIVVLASGTPNHQGNVIGFIGAEKVNGDSIENSGHNIVGPAMENNSARREVFSDFLKKFFGGLADVIKVFYRGLASAVRSAEFKLRAMFGKDRGDDPLNGNDLISRESFTCGGDSGEISHLASAPVFVSRIVLANNLKSFLSVPLIALSACLNDCHKLILSMANKYYKYNLLSRSILVYK